jgi:hypothetical protein
MFIRTEFVREVKPWRLAMPVGNGLSVTFSISNSESVAFEKVRVSASGLLSALYFSDRGLTATAVRLSASGLRKPVPYAMSISRFLYVVENTTSAPAKPCRELRC